MNNLGTRILVAVVFLTTAQMVFSAEVPSEESLPTLKSKVKTVAVFKNGLGFVVRSGESGLKEGWGRVDSIPPAALGTLWIGSTKPGHLVEEWISHKKKMVVERDAENLQELLAACAGQKVTLGFYLGGKAERMTGVIQSNSRGEIKDFSPEENGEGGGGTYRPNLNPDLLIFKPEKSGGLLAIPRSGVQSVELADGIFPKYKAESIVRWGKYRVSGKPANTEIVLSYLEKGLNWSPSYLVSIDKEKEAQITMEAVLVNDAEDLEDADLSFVVGFPNFLYADVLSPLALRESLNQFIQRLGTDRRSDGFGRNRNLMAQSVMGNSAVYDRSEGGAVDYSAVASMGLESGGDLYFYKQNRVTLKKGERGRYLVFSEKIPVESIHEWVVPDSQSVGESYSRSESSKDQPIPVWHVLRLENKTPFPWTTAPAFTIKDKSPVAQDLLGYTPPGGKSTLRLTVATDIRAEQTQIESSRKAVTTAYRNYDEVAVNGRLTLKNYKKTPAKMNVKKLLAGDVLSAESGKFTKNAKTLSAVNANSQIEWEFELAAGGEKELSYQYKVLVSR